VTDAGPVSRCRAVPLAAPRSPSLLLMLALVVPACPHADPSPAGRPADAALLTPSSLAAPEGPAPTLAPPLPLADVEPSTLDSDESVSFLPTFAVLRDGTWRVPVDAWVYEPEADDLGRLATVTAIAEALEHTADSPESDTIAANLRPFVVDNERGEWVAMRRGPHAVRVGPTTPDGRAASILTIPEGDPATVGEGTPPWLALEVVLPRGDDRRLSAWAQLLPDEGVSVVSDIDDTIKITNVLDRREMLANTFLRPYRAVPGMAGAYRRFAAQGVAFHYVSASPLPLLGALAELAGREGFPRGSLALRPFRWVDGTAIELLEPSEGYKTAIIAAIIASFERRAFVLIGDTGERDPEIYADIARRFPGRIRAIHLRDPVAGGTPGVQARLEAAYEGLPRSLWHVIVDGEGLPATLAR
jgi:Uncharacterized conserved protein (DUF2183)